MRVIPPPSVGAEVDGDRFPKIVPVTDDQPSFFAAEFFVLRRAANHAVGMENIIAANGGVAGDNHMAQQLASGANDHIRPDSTEWPDLAIVGDVSFGIDQRQG